MAVFDPDYPLGGSRNYSARGRIKRSFRPTAFVFDHSILATFSNAEGFTQSVTVNKVTGVRLFSIITGAGDLFPVVLDDEKSHDLGDRIEGRFPIAEAGVELWVYLSAPKLLLEQVQAPEGCLEKPTSVVLRTKITVFGTDA